MTYIQIAWAFFRFILWALDRVNGCKSISSITYGPVNGEQNIEANCDLNYFAVIIAVQVN